MSVVGRWHISRACIFCRRCLADSAGPPSLAPLLIRTIGKREPLGPADTSPERIGARAASHVGGFPGWMHGVDGDGPTMARPRGSRPSAAAALARSHGGAGAAGATWGWFRSGVALASPWRRDARTRWRAAQRGGCCGGVSRACETIVRPLAARGRPTPRRLLTCLLRSGFPALPMLACLCRDDPLAPPSPSRQIV